MNMMENSNNIAPRNSNLTNNGPVQVPQRRHHGLRKLGCFVAAISALILISIGYSGTPATATTLKGTMADVATLMASKIASAKTTFTNHAMPARDMKLAINLESYRSMLVALKLPNINMLPTIPKMAQLQLHLPSMNTLHGLKSVKSTAKTSSHAILAFTAESAELAWEKSESLLQHLSSSLTENHNNGNAIEEQKDDNVFTKALEGIALHLRGRKDENGSKKSLETRDAKKEGGSVRKEQQQKKESNRRERQVERGNRRLSVQEDKVPVDSSSHLKDGGNTWTWSFKFLSNSLATTLLVFCGVAFLVASFVSNQIRSTRSRRGERPLEGRSIILDEEEAEIVEFYEKEMESGTLFAYDNGQDEGGDDDDNLHTSKNVEGANHVQNEVLWARKPEHHSCDVNSPSRHDSRESSYYSRLLQDIGTLTCDDDENELVEEHIYREECPYGLLNEECTPEGGNIDNQDAGESDVNQVYGATSPTAPLSAMDSIEVHDDEPFQPHSPSSSSSISSLTTEHMDCDIESAQQYFSRSLEGRQEETRLVHSQESSSLLLCSSSMKMTPSLTESEERVSSTIITPTRSNVSRDRRRSSSMDITSIKRQVSFSPEVKVNAPPAVKQGGRPSLSAQEQNTMSASEKYLYIMIFTVAIAIAVVSIIPIANPKSFDCITSVVAKACSTIYNPSKSSWSVEL